MTKYKSLRNLKRPILFAFSADQSEETIKKTKEVGFDRFISSPLTEEKFMRELKFITDKVIKRAIANEFLPAANAQYFFELMERSDD